MTAEAFANAGSFSHGKHPNALGVAGIGHGHLRGPLNQLSRKTYHDEIVYLNVSIPANVIGDGDHQHQDKILTRSQITRLATAGEYIELFGGKVSCLIPQFKVSR
ncbi:hypothetical protein [Skermanella stibiiresistens]|uniref:hypothetical protein n=1 Tax=Skermanella stibiiresistens TaxID=913326 RepID=UPI0012F986AC|nr:hypothetical protein [Skermanella stibiiresistens]